MSYPDDNRDEELDPSTGSDPDAEARTEESEQAEDATSSSATGGSAEPESDLLAVVRDVVSEQEPPTEDATASPAEGDEDEEPETEETASEEQDDEDYSDVPFHKHPRFQQLLRKAKTHEDDARRYRDVEAFLDQNGLAAEEAAELLMVGGLMKTNPTEAWARIKPHVQRLLVAAGEVLPDDLRQRVANNELSQQAALEMSRLRAQRSSDDAVRTFEQQRQERVRQQEASQTLMSAAESWERDRRAKDPNFEAKYEPLMDRVYALQRREGVPKTAEGVRDQLNRAYRSVAPPRPAASPPRTARSTNSTGQVAGNQRPADMSTLDIIRANRRAS